MFRVLGYPMISAHPLNMIQCNNVYVLLLLYIVEETIVPCEQHIDSRKAILAVMT